MNQPNWPACLPRQVHITRLSSQVVICNIPPACWLTLISPHQSSANGFCITGMAQPGADSLWWGEICSLSLFAVLSSYLIRSNSWETQQWFSDHCVCVCVISASWGPRHHIGYVRYGRAHIHMHTHTYIYVQEHTHTSKRVRYANSAWISSALSCFVHQQLGVRYHITDRLQRHVWGQWIRTWSILGKEIQEVILKWTELN